jgi:4-amino-4-deoxy-L-arabinose transferase-like glycosyltransferase
MRDLTNILAGLIIAGGILLRLRDINSLPVEAQSWRQNDTAALARNYAEEGYRLFYPTIDWRGHTSGYVESELSIYAFTVALAYGVLGEHEIIARLVTVAAWALAAWLLFLIGRRAFGNRASIFALAFFAFWSPFSIFLGRAIMGDMPAQTFAIIAIYAALRWQERGELKWFTLAMAGAAAAALSKLPLLYIGVPLAAIVIQHEGIRALARPRNWIGAISVLGIVGGWYWHAHQIGLQTGLNLGFVTKNSLFTKGAPDTNQWISDWAFLSNIGVYQGFLYNFTWRLLTTFGVGLTVAGLLLPRRPRSELPILMWVLAVLIYFLVAAPTVLWSDYYTIALLPPAALYIGKAVDHIVTWIAGWLRRPELGFKLGALGLAVAGLAGVSHATFETAASVNDLFEPREPILQAQLTGQWIQAVVPKNARIITVGGEQPTGLYFAHRYGLWFGGEGEDYELFSLDKLAKQKWKYLVVYNPYWSNVNKPWLIYLHTDRKLIGGGPWFLAYDISQRALTPPQHMFEPAPQWANQISLLGYDLTPERVVNSNLHLVLYWRKDGDTPRGYTDFMHVLDQNGKLCGQDDHEPLKGFYSQDMWKKGETFADPVEVDVSNCSPAGELTLEAGLYIPESGERLPATGPVNENQAYTFRIDLQR